MSMMGRGAVTAIGIDVGTAHIKAAQLSRTRRGWRIAALAVCERLERSELPSDAEIDRLAEVLDRAGFWGDEVVVGAPRARLHTAVLELPPRKSGAPLEQICQAEVARMFRLAPGAYEMHAWEVPAVSSRSTMTQMATSVLACDDARSFIAPFERAGLQVVAIDLTTEATARACADLMRGLPELAAVADFGEDGIDLIVFRAGERVYHRRLEGSGMVWAVQTLARKLSISTGAARVLVRRFGLSSENEPGPGDTALARARELLREQVNVMLQEMLASVSYALDRFPGESITALRLAGGGASTPGLAAYLSEISGLGVELVTPGLIARGFTARPRAKADPGYMTAVGHALWGSTA